ncbi:MAG TPA: nitrate- and nitrite sensing domain-containing protein, partial [Micromonosporaceae bacterium]|nr:nitrate- and nitrite sensing domain-containing protein [Micromonosporaceae bacterium]
MGPWERDGSPVPRAGQRTPANQPAVMPHVRPRLWKSVRVRLLLPVVLASAGVLILGTAQLDAAVTQAEQARRSSELSRAAGAVSAVAHHVSLEYVRVNESLRESSETPELARQQAATDSAITEFKRVSETIRTAAPELTELTDATVRALDAIGSARAVAQQSPEGTAEVRAFYDQMVRAALALGDALASQMSDPQLVELARGLTLVGELYHVAAQQYDLVARGLARQDFEPADPFLLAQLVGAEAKQIDALQSLDVPGARYRELVNQGQIAAAASIRQVILDGRGTRASLGVNPDAWAEAQGARMDGLWEMERQLAVDLRFEAEEIGGAARNEAYFIGLLTLGVVGGTLAAAITIAVRLSRRLRQTRRAALMAAGFELPGAVANVIAARDEDAVSSAIAESSGRVDSLLRPEPDEIGELAAAFGAVHRQALRLAADQALLRMEVQAMFVALSRRGQTLVQRQIHLIDEFSRNETDPDVLERLFALDHLAARMRRNEENLLVLAGGEPGRWITRPVAMIDLLRAAAQEIEEYRRVDIEDVPSVAVSAHVAGDAIHLLAELLENATSFSPPTSRVRMSASRTVDGLAVRVV